MLSSEMTADLLRTPPLRQQLGDRLEQFRVDIDAPAMMASTPSHRLPMGIVRTILICPGGSGIALELAVDRRPGPLQLFGDLRDADTLSAEVGDEGSAHLRTDTGN